MRRAVATLAPGVVLAIAIAISGCGPSSADVVGERRAAAESKLAALAAVGELLATPPAEEPALGILEGKPALALAGGSRSNGVVMWPGAFADLGAFDESLLDVTVANGRWAFPARYLADPESADPNVPEAVAMEFDGLAAIRYVIVLRPDELLAPRWAEAGVGGDEEFHGGRFVGHALLFDVEGPARLGRFPLRAESSDSVDGLGMDDVERDLSEQIKKALYDGLIEHLGDRFDGAWF